MIKLDGGLSTALENNGNNLNTSLWSGELIRSKPDEITRAHLDFINAGSQIIITSSYQISYLGCEKRGWSDLQVEQALRDSTSLAKAAVNKSGRDVKIAASVGPYGAALADGSEYKGDYGVSKSALKDFHARRLDILISTSPDYLALETMPDTFEVEVLVELLKDCPIPYWISYSCKEGNQTNAGQSFQSAIDVAEAAALIGINCTKPELITELIRSAKSSKPFVIYPNSGRIWDADRKIWTGSAGAGFSTTLIQEWVEAGAQIIGGCCGIGANEINELSLIK